MVVDPAFPERGTASFKDSCGVCSPLLSELIGSWRIFIAKFVINLYHVLRRVCGFRVVVVSGLGAVRCVRNSMQSPRDATRIDLRTGFDWCLAVIHR